MNSLIGFFDLARDILQERWALLLLVLVVSVAVIAVSVSVFSAADALSVHNQPSLNDFIAMAGR